jgi:hypothetical protein
MVGRLNDLSVYWIKELSGSKRDSQNIPEEDYPPEEGYFRNVSCTLNVISTFSLKESSTH